MRLVATEPSGPAFDPNGRRTRVRPATTGVNSRKLIASYPGSEFVERGGLIAYAVNYPIAGFVDKIIKGEKPSEIPVEGPTKFEVVINQKTAKTLGLTVPGSLLLRADRLIQ